jgi:hypothetical protein
MATYSYLDKKRKKISRTPEEGCDVAFYTEAFRKALTRFCASSALRRGMWLRCSFDTGAACVAHPYYSTR